MGDTLHALASVHPALLTRQCEVCGGRGDLADVRGDGFQDCPAECDGGRRLATLDELLAAIEAHVRVFVRAITILPPDTDDNESTEYVVSVLSGGTPERGYGATRWEAAARLLVELEAARG